MLFLVGITSFKKNFKLVSKSDLLLILFLGVIDVFINQWSFFKGLQLQTADPTTYVIILAMTPILTGLLATLFLRKN
ncbi:EamA family transporter [Paenibacillus sp. FSL K6-0276]|uniref:EamA family transporter n=1 Tax=Paenibacillus sp. FSL K6-0276 TaxID=2921450 RepID=UPI0030EBBF73